ncbi:PREDICTED: uncharacterized protein LOC109220938 [Nicotiana attenuata]|uniref:uncharacterized protein LOC109220938 n=1 Tax=Nicotiana attenuata TaxID=49451 RepID=UPI0009049ED2|nr:PREDICTED: uncharacterized protein LOC109220938 [Nicotiana attenuata]
MNDYSLFTKSTPTSLTVLDMYVDDILLAGDDVVELDCVKLFLDQQFKIKDLGRIHYFLGLEVTKCPEGYIISQQKFTQDLLAEFHCHNFPPVVTPLDTSVKLSADMAPQVPHMLAALHALRYLSNALALGILLSSSFDTSIKAYSDSDWAACAESRRSVYGFYITLGGSPISWKSKKQPTVSLSSAEAEYKALRKVVAEVSWLVKILDDLGLHVSAPVPIYCDSLALPRIRSSMKGQSISKLIATISAQLADIMTKPLPGPLHHYLLGKLGKFVPFDRVPTSTATASIRRLEMYEYLFIQSMKL